MNVDEYKKEFIERYLYISNNADIILSSAIYNTNDLRKKNPYYKWNDLRKKYSDYKWNGYKYHVIISPDKDILNNLESLLLFDELLDNNVGYKYFEYLKNNAKYKKYVQNQMRKVEKHNSNVPSPFFQIELNAYQILTELYEYVKEQSGDLNNKKLKLLVIDEYIRVSRFKNDGKAWTSGYDLTFHDIEQKNNLSAVIPPKRLPSRAIDDIGISSNGYIDYIAKHPMFLTEKERQDIYLMLHDEQPAELGELNKPSEEIIVKLFRR